MKWVLPWKKLERERIQTPTGINNLILTVTPVFDQNMIMPEIMNMHACMHVIFDDKISWKPSSILSDAANKFTASTHADRIKN